MNMTKDEMVKKLTLICEDKINKCKIYNKEKLEMYETILNILKTPKFYEKQDIEVTLNILKDLGIDDDYLIECIKVFVG